MSGLANSSSARTNSTARDSECGPIPGWSATFDRALTPTGRFASACLNAAAKSPTIISSSGGMVRVRVRPTPQVRRAGTASPRLGGSTFISSTQRSRRHLRGWRSSRAQSYRRSHQIHLGRLGSHSVTCLDCGQIPTQTNSSSTTKAIHCSFR